MSSVDRSNKLNRPHEPAGPRAPPKRRSGAKHARLGVPGTVSSVFGMAPMIRDFWHFMHHAFELLHFVRGALFGLLLILLVCSVLLVVAEGMGFGEAVYLTAITALTIGYGDITPTTAVGRIVAVMIGFVGVIWVGINVAIANRALAQGFKGSRRQDNAPPGGEKDA